MKKLICLLLLGCTTNKSLEIKMKFSPTVVGAWDILPFVYGKSKLMSDLDKAKKAICCDEMQWLKDVDARLPGLVMIDGEISLLQPHNAWRACRGLESIANRPMNRTEEEHVRVTITPEGGVTCHWLQWAGENLNERNQLSRTVHYQGYEIKFCDTFGDMEEKRGPNFMVERAIELHKDGQKVDSAVLIFKQSENR